MSRHRPLDIHVLYMWRFFCVLVSVGLQNRIVMTIPSNIMKYLPVHSLAHGTTHANACQHSVSTAGGILYPFGAMCFSAFWIPCVLTFYIFTMSLIFKGPNWNRSLNKNPSSDHVTVAQEHWYICLRDWISNGM